jgi:hypothetical protein
LNEQAELKKNALHRCYEGRFLINWRPLFGSPAILLQDPLVLRPRVTTGLLLSRGMCVDSVPPANGLSNEKKVIFSQKFQKNILRNVLNHDQLLLASSQLKRSNLATLLINKP